MADPRAARIDRLAREIAAEAECGAKALADALQAVRRRLGEVPAGDSLEALHTMNIRFMAGARRIDRELGRLREEFRRD